jgi:NAD(P)-dependent dehydrogenase (short-subunit alcohol dehydrogenase family)
MNRLKNKVAVITGGNSGIGKGIAMNFYNQGAKVVILGRNQELLDEAKNEMGGSVLAIKGDVSKTDDLKNLYERTMSQYGKIDVLVANAGVGERLHVEKVKESDFDYVVDINYRGVYFTVKYALEYLNKNASIILIASCAATITVQHHSVYASTKAAVVKLAKNFAKDLSDNSIRVNSISPGYITTPIFAKRLETDPEYLTRREALIPLKRIGTPEDVGNAALFLASDESSYITGIDLLVDGGIAASYNEP